MKPYNPVRTWKGIGRVKLKRDLTYKAEFSGFVLFTHYLRRLADCGWQLLFTARGVVCESKNLSLLDLLAFGDLTNQITLVRSSIVERQEQDRCTSRWIKGRERKIDVVERIFLTAPDIFFLLRSAV